MSERDPMFKAELERVRRDNWERINHPEPELCKHKKGKMIDFNEETFVGTWLCKICGMAFSSKASIVCSRVESGAQGEGND